MFGKWEHSHGAFMVNCAIKPAVRSLLVQPQNLDLWGFASEGSFIVRRHNAMG